MYIPGLVVVVRHPEGESLPLRRLGLSVGTFPGREAMEPGSLGSRWALPLSLTHQSRGQCRASLATASWQTQQCPQVGSFIAWTDMHCLVHWLPVLARWAYHGSGRWRCRQDLSKPQISSS